MNKTSLNLYRDRSVLVTGHTGFVGGWLSMWLKQLGAKVIGYSLEPPTDPSFFESMNLQSKIDSHNVGDVRDLPHLMQVFQEHEPEVVFHLAAQPLVRQSYTCPKLTYETNVMGTVNLLEAVRKTGSVKVCIVITSDKCYENKEWHFGYRETDPMGGYDPYSSSKGCAELVTAAYRSSFFSPEEYGKIHSVGLSTVRAGNILGGGDWRQDRLIPDSVISLTQNRDIVIRNPMATRPWQFVLEPLSGYLWLGALMYHHGSKYSDSWNLGPNDDTILTVDELIHLLLKQWGSGEYDVCKTDELHEASFLKLDISKANLILKWRPVYSICDTVKETVMWYKAFYSEIPKDIYKTTTAQIDKYVEKAKDKNLLWAENI